MSPIVSHGDPLFPASYLILLLLLSFSQNEKAGWEQNNQGMLCPARGKVGQMTNSFIPQILYLEAFPHHPGASIRGHQVARYPSGKGMPSTQRQQCGFHNHSYPFLRRVPMKSSRLPSRNVPPSPSSGSQCHHQSLTSQKLKYEALWDLEISLVHCVQKKERHFLCHLLLPLPSGCPLKNMLPPDGFQGGWWILPSLCWWL